MSEENTIETVAELLAHAKAIETEAHDRYLELAEQMETHHNLEVAQLFAKMAHIESLHIEKIIERTGETELPHIPPWEYQWQGREAPEAVISVDVHYMMTPYHALKLAMRAETRACEFFSRIAASSTDPDLLSLAQELKEEEEEHIELLKAWIAKVPKPEDGWDDDPDPPILPA